MVHASICWVAYLGRPVLGMQVGSSSLVKSYHASKVRNEGKLSLYFHMLFMTRNDVKYAIPVRNDG
jgi:hypothetical protein